MKFKRCVALTLLSLLLVPVLAFSGSAAEIYEFEYVELPMMYSDEIVFKYHDIFMCEGNVPAGMYIVSWVVNGVPGGFSEPLALAFDLEMDLDGTPCHVSLYEFDGKEFCVVNVDNYDCAYMMFDALDMGPDDVASATLTRVGDLPSSGSVDVPGMMSGVVEQMHEFSTVNLLTILGATVGACVGVVIIWFGYRYSKRKISSALKKGKM